MIGNIQIGNKVCKLLIRVFKCILGCWPNKLTQKVLKTFLVYFTLLRNKLERLSLTCTSALLQ